MRVLYMLACLPVAILIGLMAMFLWLQNEWLEYKA